MAASANSALPSKRARVDPTTDAGVSGSGALAAAAGVSRGTESREGGHLVEGAFRYMSGFGNEFASEALPGALPKGQNNPQVVSRLQSQPSHAILRLIFPRPEG